MTITDCFPPDFERFMGDGSFFFLFPTCYFVSTNLKVNIVFLNIDSVFNIYSLPWKKF